MVNAASENRGTRRLLARIAELEAVEQRAGNADMARPEIERYLAVFRESINRNGETTEFSNTSVGFPWCCAFVYYCCQRAGFHFPTKPVESYRHTLAAVPAWLNWSQSEGTFHAVASTRAAAGDIALFNNAYVGKPLDHIGIVVAVRADHVLCAEGNNAYRSGIFERSYSQIEGYVRLPECA